MVSRRQLGSVAKAITAIVLLVIATSGCMTSANPDASPATVLPATSASVQPTTQPTLPERTKTRAPVTNTPQRTKTQPTVTRTPSPTQAAGSVALDDQGCALDEATLEAAANELVELGAQVIIVCTANAHGDALKYLGARVEQFGLAGYVAEKMPGNTIIQYVSLDPRYLALARGNDFTNLSESELEDIRTGYMVPQLQRGDFTAAFVTGLHQLSICVQGGNKPGRLTPLPLPEGQSRSAC
jgi:hypothetical protein